MRAIRLHQVGGSELLLYEDALKPSPKDNQVLVQVYATAITPTEFAWYPTFHTPEGSPRPFPIILGHEFSGVVDAIGQASMGVQVGDRGLRQDGLEDVVERAADCGQRLSRAEDGNRAFLPEVERPHIVKAHDVVGVLVRKQDGIKAIDLGAQGLRTEVRRGVYENVASAVTDED